MFIPYSQALLVGFPSRPHPGQRVLDSKGTLWEWREDQTGRLGDLGFWQAILGAVTGITSLFGGGGKKAQQQLQQAEQVIQQQQAQISELSQAYERRALRVDKKLIALAGIALMAYVLITR